jgi:hypothetical protein
MALNGYGNERRKPLKTKTAPTRQRPTLPVIDLDGDIQNADWIKTTWDLPYQDAESLRAGLEAEGTDVEHFKTLPVFLHNVDKPGFEWLNEL